MIYTHIYTVHIKRPYFYSATDMTVTGAIRALEPGHLVFSLGTSLLWGKLLVYVF